MTTAKSPALSAGIIPILKDQNLVLLLRSYKYWDFPKGIVEAGEDPLHAAIRELHEESGLKNPKFRWGSDFIETERYSYGKIARYYLAEVTTEKIILLENPVSGRREHDEYRWLSFSDAAKLLGPRVLTALNWAQRKLDDADPLRTAATSTALPTANN